MPRLVIFCGAIVPGFLAEPFAEGFFGLRQHKGVGVDDDGGILIGGHFIDKEVVVAAGDMVDGGEAFIAEEDRFFIGEVTADAHVGNTGERIGKVLQRGMKGIEPDDFVEEAGPFLVWAIAEHDLDPVAIAVLHLLHPEFAGGHAIGVGQEDDLVTGFLDAHAKRVFLAGDAERFVFQVNNMKSFECLFEFIEEEAGIVLAVVIDDDHFMRSWDRSGRGYPGGG